MRSGRIVMVACLALAAATSAFAQAAKDAPEYEVKVLFSFEGSDVGKYLIEDWPDEFKGKSQMTVVTEHATDGAHALRLDARSPAGNVQFFPKGVDFSRYDALAVDLFNPTDAPIKVGGWVKEKITDSWDFRHNWERVIKPGATTLRFPVGAMGTEGRKVLDAKLITCFNVSTANNTLFIDNVRLVRGVEETPVKGIRKFDFGPASSAVMPGFTLVTNATRYGKETGFGWLPGGTFYRDFDIHEVMNRHRPCDDLCRDFSTPVKATFALDLPDGDYRVWLMLAPQGATVWHRSFKHRTVTAQGQVVLDQDYNAESFKKWEFQWEDTEDLPGDDVWERYINAAYKPALFDATVADGQLKLDFDGHGDGWATMVCGLVVWPKSEETQAQKWLADLSKARKDQYYVQHVETAPPAEKPFANTVNADLTHGGLYVRFVHSPDRDVNVNSVPTIAEATTKGIDLAASRGEFQDGCFGIYPIAGCGKLKAEVSALVGPNGTAIPASGVQLLVSRYKALNHDATYAIEPKYLDTVPAEGVPAPKGVTRSFWLVVHVPDGAAPGQYAGQVKLTLAGGQAETIPVTLTVLPIKLSEIDMPMGMFGVHVPYSWLAFDPSGEGYWAGWKNVLEDAKAHGQTSLDPGMGMPLKGIEDGKAAVDFSSMDRWMEMAKAAGFNKELCGYAIGTGFSLRPQALDAIKGTVPPNAPTYAETVKAYFEAYQLHAKEKAYLPITFASDDEYLIHPGAGPAQLEKYHQILKENAPGIRFVALDSIYPDTKPDMIPAWEKMLGAIDTWGAGIHSPKLAELVKKSGSRLWLYNTGMNRFTFGTYMFYANKKWDVKGFFQWVYVGGGTLTNFDLESHRESWYGVVYPSSRGLRTTITWERIRGGCSDHRYLQTAWDLIAQAKASGKKVDEAKALETAIESTFAKMTFGKPRGVDAAEGVGKADNPMDPSQMAAFRKTLEEGIMKLQ